MAQAPPEAHVYCLYCFAEWKGSPRPGEACTQCGRRFVPTDWRKYWNRAPDLVSAERVAKLVILVASVLLCGVVILLGRVGSVTLGGWALAVPLVLAVLVWATASALTRRGTGKLRIAWYALSLLLASGIGIEPALKGRWGIAAIAFGVAAILALATCGASRALERTRAERIARGARQAAEREDSSQKGGERGT